MTLKKIGIYSLWLIALMALITVTLNVVTPELYWFSVMNFMAVTWVVIALIILVVDLIFLVPTIRGAIYLPTSESDVAKMLKLARLKSGEKAVDIGSGDGRIVRALAKSGADAHGYELNGLLVLWSKWKARHMPVSQRGYYHWANMWSIDFSSYDVVILFGMSYIMKDLETKLRRELKPGARVICNSFPFPNWPSTTDDGKLHLYIR